jgi:hypothetical protein
MTLKANSRTRRPDIGRSREISPPGQPLAHSRGNSHTVSKTLGYPLVVGQAHLFSGCDFSFAIVT